MLWSYVALSMQHTWGNKQQTQNVGMKILREKPCGWEENININVVDVN